MAIPVTELSGALKTVYRAKHGKGDDALLSALAERCAGAVEKGVLTAVHAKREFRLAFQPQQQRFTLSVDCGLVGRFRITRKNGLDRWMEDFVPARRFHSYDARFDHDFNVQTRDEELTKAILTKKPNRQAVRRLVESGGQAVHLTGARLEVGGTRKGLGAEPDPARVLDMVADLVALVEEVEAFAKRHEVRVAPKHDALLASAWTALATLGVAGFVLFLYGALSHPLVRPSEAVLPCLLLGLLPVPPVVFALALAVQMRTSPYGLVRGLAGLAFVVVPLFVTGSLLTSNGLLDGSPTERHDVSVERTNVRKQKDEERYYAGVRAWWSGGDLRWLRVSRSHFERLEPGVSRMVVETRAGALGHPWIRGYTGRR